MGLVNAIWMLVLGVLGAANLIIAKKPDAKELIEKIQPIQGWLGFLSAIWGVWQVIHGIINLKALSSNIIALVTYFSISGCLVVLGFLLGVGVLQTFIKSQVQKLKIQALAVVLNPWQGRLGVACILLGVWGILLQLGIV